MKLLAAAAFAQLLLGATSPELDLLDRAADLDTPALLLVFIWLLYRGKLRWERDITERDQAILAWQEAAGVRTRELERNASVAEAAMRATRKR